MEEEPRRLRADAERNRRKLIDAATAMICERGMDVSVGEIAKRAGVGRGTLFRNFPSKEALVIAVMADRIRESVDRGRERLAEPDAGAALFASLDEFIERQQIDRTLMDALDETWMVHPEIRAVHDEMFAVLEEIVARAQRAGAVRDDVSAVDVLLMVKGVCEAARAFANVDPAVCRRQVDLVKAALSARGSDAVALRGTPPTTADLESARQCSQPPLAAAAEVASLRDAR